MRHTPGPWILVPLPNDDPDVDDAKEIVHLSEDPREMGISIGTVYFNTDEGEANSRLLLAAPDLASACAIAWIKLKADYNSRILQPVEGEAVKIILEVLSDALKKAGEPIE